MRIKRVIFVVFVLFFAGLIGLTGALAGGYAVYQVMASRVQNPAANPDATTASAVSTQTNQVFLDATDIETSITKAVQSVAPAVVTVVGTVPGQMTFFGLSGDQTVSGSGVFISDQGYILTNNHVVEGTTAVSIVLQDGEQHEATIVGTDKYADLAVLKTSAPVPEVASLVI